MSPTPGRTKAGRHGTSRAREGVGHTIRPHRELQYRRSRSDHPARTAFTVCNGQVLRQPPELLESGFSASNFSLNTEQNGVVSSLRFAAWTVAELCLKTAPTFAPPGRGGSAYPLDRTSPLVRSGRFRSVDGVTVEWRAIRT